MRERIDEGQVEGTTRLPGGETVDRKRGGRAIRQKPLMQARKPRTALPVSRRQLRTRKTDPESQGRWKEGEQKPRGRPDWAEGRRAGVHLEGSGRIEKKLRVSPRAARGRGAGTTAQNVNTEGGQGRGKTQGPAGKKGSRSGKCAGRGRRQREPSRVRTSKRQERNGGSGQPVQTRGALSKQCRWA